MSNAQNFITKIIDQTTLENLKKSWQSDNKRIVFTNGCFDIIHRGHIHYLATAAGLGDVFIVGLNTDNSVRKLKGPNRPLQDQQSRAEILAAMKFVDHVILFEEQTPYELISRVQPDILVKGGDYLPQEIVGYDLVTRKGGKVVTIDFLEGYSTTGIIEKLKS